jgi:hypothetical protein
MYLNEPAARQSVADGSSSQSELEKLTPAEYSLLPIGECGDLHLDGICPRFGPISGLFQGFIRHTPSVSGKL